MYIQNGAFYLTKKYAFNQKVQWKVKEEKINRIAKEIYRADGVGFTSEAKKQIKELAELGFDKLPICMAKTQYSFSDDQNLLGAPMGFHNGYLLERKLYSP